MWRKIIVSLFLKQYGQVIIKYSLLAVTRMQVYLKIESAIANNTAFLGSNQPLLLGIPTLAGIHRFHLLEKLSDKTRRLERNLFQISQRNRREIAQNEMHVPAKEKLQSCVEVFTKIAQSFAENR